MTRQAPVGAASAAPRSNEIVIPARCPLRIMVASSAATGRRTVPQADVAEERRAFQQGWRCPGGWQAGRPLVGVPEGASGLV